MKCPNCMFELQAASVQCPFCNVPIPQDLDDAPTDPTVGTALDPLAPPVPVPTPDAVGTPDPVPLVGTLDPSAPVIHEDAPAEGAPAPAGGGAQATGLKLLLVAGGVFLAFQLGLLNNLLELAGMSSAPAPSAASAGPGAGAVIVPDDAPPSGPAPNFEPGLPDENRPAPAEPDVPAAPTAPAAPAAPVAAEWTLEGKVSDILSMRPVKGAVLLFMTPDEDETYEARSDAGGRWQLKLPARKDGYKLVVDHSDYIADYFDETEPPYRTWTQAKRRQLRAAKPAHKPWTAVGAEPARRDVLLFPEFTDK